MQLTEDQIYTLAPDEASKKAGRDLANPIKWVSKGISEEALWGECQGSGSKPYQTQVDLGAIAFKCSCPSRKFPCKHGLGLMLLCARQPGLFAKSTMPAWVSDWINKRAEKEEKKVEKAAEKPVDENAQAKRVQARKQKVSAGIAELMVWIKDIVRGGILTVPEKTPAYWDNMARRMVDAQASGLAGMVRNLGATNFWNDGWQSGFIDKLLQLYLVAAGYNNIQNIDPDLQQDLCTVIGFTTNQEELRAQTGVRDTWLVIGKESHDEQQLTIEQNWLYGLKTNSYALVLQFTVKGQFPPLNFSPGMYLDATLVYFPSALPYRAIVKDYNIIRQIDNVNIKTFTGWQQVAGYETILNSRLPFRNEMPVVIASLTPVVYQKQWWLQDSEGCLCKISASYTNIWQLIAISGGDPVNMAVIGRENEYRPIGVWHQNNYKSI
ncbi:SWIM zinc finger family protein [Mucilaginibacter rubeus]|uniref:SWIM zinc finger family protein n=1 Tax=Mucilaginibacter rubeus TaxID=2027860 RepID=A0AAE6MJ09_9SPHI|nr:MULTISPECIES: SWIM zinc finger family protein [Mucilaginibacter]QEM04744.1 SWIM zinc finger family protein [Mucilaginibacter rubeus]QEM17338.1 SWIM zinc finger family protein [Mucilaginibacter gossypii]QTE46147.1 SWIM zinc finger family protein [Mucilaginibacter rubeus]QTE52745.1 SWIM zinc finger family protein [Mucilaginibacter rubeus]QTE57832.1 SWIM zinc finger family protein [Mucilaginibacter rubeus]